MFLSLLYFLSLSLCMFVCILSLCIFVSMFLLKAGSCLFLPPFLSLSFLLSLSSTFFFKLEFYKLV